MFPRWSRVVCFVLIAASLSVIDAKGATITLNVGGITRTTPPNLIAWDGTYSTTPVAEFFISLKGVIRDKAVGGDGTDAATTFESPDIWKATAVMSQEAEVRGKLFYFSYADQQYHTMVTTWQAI